MRKIIASEMISLDGFFEGPHADISWHNVDDEFNSYALELMKHVDTIIFGRKTYQFFESYWPAAVKDPATIPADVQIGTWIDNANKVLFSKSLTSPTWKNTTQFKEITAQEVN